VSAGHLRARRWPVGTIELILEDFVGIVKVHTVCITWLRCVLRSKNQGEKLVSNDQRSSLPYSLPCDPRKIQRSSETVHGASSTIGSPGRASEVRTNVVGSACSRKRRRVTFSRPNARPTGPERTAASSSATYSALGTSLRSIRYRASGTTLRSASRMMPSRPYPPRAAEKISEFSVRLQRMIRPSASSNRNDSTVLARGGRSFCHPWQLTLRPPIETTFSAWTTMLPRRRPGPVDKVICASGLSEPPTVNGLSDCMIETDKPRTPRKGITSSHFAPAWT